MTANEGLAPATCAVCGADFEIGLHNRCESCGALCCRNCLKLTYSEDPEGRPVVRRILCYYCHHGIKPVPNEI
jgi:hypothetical protein